MTTVTTRSTRLLLNRDVMNGLLVGAALTGGSYLIAAIAGWVTALSPLEIVAVATSYTCTFLCVKQRRINYVFALVSTAAYAVLFFQTNLLASAALNLYLIPTVIYGWFRWRSDEFTRPVTRVRPRWIPAYLAVTAASFAGALWLISALGSQFALTDSLILVGSVLAQFLLDNKKIETWAVWIVVNVLAIWQYFSVGLALAGMQYVFFLANAAWALTVWQRSMREGRPL